MSKLRIPSAFTAAMLGVFVLVALGIASIAGAEPVGPIDGSAYRLPAGDASRLSDLRFDPAPVDRAIPKAQAISVASARYDITRLGGKTVDAYLERITAPVTDPLGAPLSERAVWIVRVGGLALPGEGLAGGSAPDHTLTVLYVFVDGNSGDFIYAEWQE